MRPRKRLVEIRDPKPAVDVDHPGKASKYKLVATSTGPVKSNENHILNGGNLRPWVVFSALQMVEEADRAGTTPDPMVPMAFRSTTTPKKTEEEEVVTVTAVPWHPPDNKIDSDDEHEKMLRRRMKEKVMTRLVQLRKKQDRILEEEGEREPELWELLGRKKKK